MKLIFGFISNRSNTNVLIHIKFELFVVSTMAVSQKPIKKTFLSMLWEQWIQVY